MRFSLLESMLTQTNKKSAGKQSAETSNSRPGSEIVVNLHLSHLSPFPKSPAFSTSHSFFQLSEPTKRKGGRHTPHSSANVCGCNHPTMICLYLSQPYSASLFSLNPSLIPSSIPKFKPAFHCFPKIHKKKKKINRGICRAEFSPDAPLAAAIGACMLSSLLLPAADTGEEDGGSSIIDAGDTRFAAMGIISFIPYFNWLSWVFAWLDSGKRRYAVYSVVYLVPYLRSNFSLSPEDSWLPIASILFCIVHVQLEASIRNGDLQGFQIFSEAAKHLSSRSREEDEHFKGYNEPKKGEHRNLPDAEEHSRNEIPHWGTPKRPSQHHEQLNDLEDDGKSEH